MRNKMACFLALAAVFWMVSPAQAMTVGSSHDMAVLVPTTTCNGQTAAQEFTVLFTTVTGANTDRVVVDIILVPVGNCLSQLSATAAWRPNIWPNEAVSTYGSNDAVANAYANMLMRSSNATTITTANREIAAAADTSQQWRVPPKMGFVAARGEPGMCTVKCDVDQADCQFGRLRVPTKMSTAFEHAARLLQTLNDSGQFIRGVVARVLR
jgi:hypothetical protein